MRYETHQCGGLCAGLSASMFLIQDKGVVEATVITMILMSTAMIGSLLPDIDEPNSKAGQKIKPVSKMIKRTCGHRGIMHSLIPVLIFLLLPGILLTPYAYLISDNVVWVLFAIISAYFMILSFKMFKGQKKRMFSPIIILISWGLLVYCRLFIDLSAHQIFTWIMLGLAFGDLSHLFLDMLTKSGVPILMPFTSKSISIMKLKTGKHEWVGKLIVCTITILIVVFKLKGFINYDALTAYFEVGAIKEFIGIVGGQVWM